VARLATRLRAIEAGELVVVGVNRYEESEPSPLATGIGAGLASIERIEQETEDEQVERLHRWRSRRGDAGVRRGIEDLKRAASAGDPLVEASIAAAKAGVTTGEWAFALRDVFGEYRPPTGVGERAVGANGNAYSLEGARQLVADAAKRLGVQRVRLLMAKPGLDGHSNAAEQIAVRARDAGFEVIYQGIRLTPEEIARAASDEDVHVIGLSVLSGSHLVLVPQVLARLREEGVDPEAVPVVVGGIIPDEDAKELMKLGVARVFTPADSDVTHAVGEIAALLA
jgi:(2R)-ethylmalonyl-CoA mutase